LVLVQVQVQIQGLGQESLLQAWAYPDLRLDWVQLGQIQPRLSWVLEQRLVQVQVQILELG